MIVKNHKMTNKDRIHFRGFKSKTIECVNMCLDVIKSKKLVNNFDEFNEKLLVNIKTINTAYGGINKQGYPHITICRNDRFWNKEKHINKILNQCENNWNFEEAKKYAKLNKWLFVEYRSFHKDEWIGGFISNSKERHLLGLIAHEVSHACDYFDGDNSAHGNPWRYRYKELRKSFYLKRKI